MVGVAHRQYGWREQAAQVASELHRARSAVETLNSDLERNDTKSARRDFLAVREKLGSVAEQVKALRAEQPPIDELGEPDATASTLAITGSGVATVALDVLVNAMVAMSAAGDEDNEETDFLVGACMDAELAYLTCTAIVHAAPESEKSEVHELKQAFDTDGGKALRKRVNEAHSKVLQINRRDTGHRQGRRAHR